MRLICVVGIAFAFALIGSFTEAVGYQQQVSLNCTDAFEVPRACRTFSATQTSHGLSFEAYWFEEGNARAESALQSLVKVGEPSRPIVIDQELDVVYRAFQWTNASYPDHSGFSISFVVSDMLAMWSSYSLEESENQTILIDLLKNLNVEGAEDLSIRERFWQLIPEMSALEGFSVSSQDVSRAPSDEQEIESSVSDQSDIDLEELIATVESLETRVADLEAGQHAPTQVPTARPTARPTAQPTPTPGSAQNTLSVSNLSARDAGTGDGSIYIYADLHNGTSEFYSFVTLNATCRDTAGSTVGTAPGFAQNVAPGATVTVTFIMLSVPTCDTYEIRVESAF